MKNNPNCINDLDSAAQMSSADSVDQVDAAPSKKPKRILLLGATGSIGTQTLDVISQHPDQLEVVGVCANASKEKLEHIIEAFPSIQKAGLCALQDGTLAGVPLYGGEDAMVRLIEDPELEYDLLVNAAVGFAGLQPTLAALNLKKDVALANKESLVCGGELVKAAMEKSGSRLYPIDSEHSAIFQCLQGNERSHPARLIITASGGSFRNRTRDELHHVTKEQALAHPNWNMGARITLDSATMVNKGFEVIEAHYLFDMPFDQIDTVLHDESIVHSMVEFEDHAIMAQLGSADMRLPIQYALLYPNRPVLHEEKPLDMTKTMQLHFKEMDFERFPILKTIYEAGRAGGNRGCVVNAADEQAVALFLEGKIQFLDIENAIHQALEHIPQQINPSYEQLKQTDLKIREFVRNLTQN